MMCPVCKRELAPTLSICFTCGAMVNDTVREELETKIERISGPLRKPPVTELSENRKEDNGLPQESSSLADDDRNLPAPNAVSVPRSRTMEFPTKPTSPTLVDFQPKNSTLPEWRLQIQNSVRKRTDKASLQRMQAPEPIRVQVGPDIVGDNSLEKDASVSDDRPQNPMIANALRRIEASRRTFLPEVEAANTISSPKSYPFNVVGRNRSAAAAAAPAPTLSPSPKPRLISSLKIEKKKYDTNRLPQLPEPLGEGEELIPDTSQTPDVSQEILASAIVPAPESVAQRPLFVPTENGSGEIVSAESEEEYDDLASFSMRFGAGLFDIALGTVGTLLILSPFMSVSERWFSWFGGLAFVASLATIVFLYLTASIALWGRSLGMRLFSLELIDAEQSAYPTLHQAAVNSAVYLLSFAFFGLGFLTIIFNEEKRAFHDIVSGTILIRDIS